MDCVKCSKKAVIDLQHGALCKIHFISYFEDKVFKTINKYKLIGRADRLCVATSGGKDSLTVLYLTQKYLTKNNFNVPLFALVIDEGISGYREKTIADLEVFCAEHNVEMKKVSVEKEFGATLDKAYPIINKGTKKKPCNICGVWRRSLLNKYARENGATKLVTGHNLDDEAQAIMMNIFKANSKLAGRLGPISGVQGHELFARRVKPLYFCTEKEVRLYTLLKCFNVEYSECPYSQGGYRHEILEMLNNFENKFAGTKQGVVRSFLALLPLLEEKERDNIASIKVCVRCSEPATKEVCNACTMREVLENE